MNAPRKICAVVPAAGRGSRLGADVPKVFVPLRPGLLLWDALRDKLAAVADEIVLVLSPEGRRYVAENRLPPASFEKTTLAVQPVPLGMGDAVFGAAFNHWREADDLLIVWGDQVNLSADTLAGIRKLHQAAPRPCLTLPLVGAAQPYVEYIFDPDGTLTAVRQSREGDVCAPNGLSDVGTFLLTGGDALETQWRHYLAAKTVGTRTAEINFLPFLVHLSREAHWPVHRYDVTDPAEAIGVNTPEELAFAREMLEKKRS
jgi:bifunctional UDP-N-acetylglucosamine pyrophosphorylase/glucosamine-1-phosphate N-acetyltransferase